MKMFPNQMQEWNDCVGLGSFTNNNIIMLEAGVAGRTVR